ncbi:DUF7310 family coiled-coil domain-containing protein [Halovenus sp. HT40]|uniref:DUF7310 family coiled-coil domain-containing protein n=1 Tax=Halovenus sp. HT40 TaxID=3126691 RepID=UPI00300EE26A
MDDALEERIEALERTVSDGEFDHESSEYAEMETRLAAVESQLDEIETRIDDLEAATQALRGYVGNIRAVNDDIEQRANTALAKAEALERAAQSTVDGQTAAGENRKQALSNSSADGDRSATSEAEQSGNERCQACGRTHDSETGSEAESRATNPPSATDGGAATHRNPPGETNDDPLFPDDAAETGTLQRIRELL